MNFAQELQDVWTKKVDGRVIESNVNPAKTCQVEVQGIEITQEYSPEEIPEIMKIIMPAIAGMVEKLGVAFSSDHKEVRMSEVAAVATVANQTKKV